jgi:hypothetical protein
MILIDRSQVFSITGSYLYLYLITVRDSNVLKNKCIFLSASVWFVIICKRKILWLDEQIHYFILVWLSCLICITKQGHAWAASVLLVLMRIGPPRLHVLSSWLQYITRYVDGTVYRRLHTLPPVTVWPSCPKFGCLTESSQVHTCTHTMLQIILRNMMGQQ